jgi:hypothetical protein
MSSLNFWQNLNTKNKQSTHMLPINYLSIIGFFVNNASTITILVLTGVFAILIAEILLASWKKPKLLIAVDNRKQGKLGFSVCVRKKEVKNVTVTCNGVKYQWEKDDGTRSDEVNLRINDDPVSFYPFDVAAEFSDDLSEPRFWDISTHKIKQFSGALSLLVTEPTDRRIVQQVNYAIPIHSKYLMIRAHYSNDNIFPVRIRIVGEGLEDESDYILNVGLHTLLIHPIVDGKPLLEYLFWVFEVKHTSKFVNRKRRAILIY